MSNASHIRGGLGVLLSLLICCLTGCKKDNNNTPKQPGNFEPVDQDLIIKSHNTSPPVELNDALINRIQAPDEKNEEKYRFFRQVLQKVARGEEDVNSRWNFDDGTNRSLVEWAIMMDPPIDLLQALKHKNADFESYIYQGEQVYSSMVAWAAAKASFNVLRWLVENEQKLQPHPDSPSYMIVVDFWNNPKLTQRQLKALTKALIPKGLDIDERANEETLLHRICRKPKNKSDQKGEIDIVEALFAIDELIDIRRSLHMENHQKLVPWEVAYNNSYYELAVVLIKKMNSLQEIRQRIVKKDETFENASGLSHMKRFKQLDPADNNYQMIKQAFLTIPGVDDSYLTPLSEMVK